ncbi:CD3324 family protein [Vallitalea guaymasensis]|uniref:CD3324 family protein n=1 Tax=Vallitalea guaymasensis TaxID=1185412 RepID=UPI002356843F|nr:CD3324 family protein [Vallitalea guaymasensis]
MSYIKATKLLPKDLIEIIQDYIDGEYIYIPKKENNRKSWGENTTTKKDLAVRNINIYEKYKNGYSVKELADEFYLSQKSIQRIILNIKKKYC